MQNFFHELKNPIDSDKSADNGGCSTKYWFYFFHYFANQTLCQIYIFGLVKYIFPTNKLESDVTIVICLYSDLPKSVECFNWWMKKNWSLTSAEVIQRNYMVNKKLTMITNSIRMHPVFQEFYNETLCT